MVSLGCSLNEFGLVDSVILGTFVPIGTSGMVPSTCYLSAGPTVMLLIVLLSVLDILLMFAAKVFRFCAAL